MPTLSPSQDDFRQLISNLAPTGDAWPTETDAVMQQVFAAQARLVQRLQARANYLLVDAFPKTTVELLPEWEKSLGLPDTCTPIGATIQQRQLAVVAKLIARGGRTQAYFISVAAALGYEITITLFAPFRADASCADDACYDDEWAFAWQVNVTGTITDTIFTADASYADEPLDAFDTSSLACRLRQIAPASRMLLFNYLLGIAPSNVGSFVVGASPIGISTGEGIGNFQIGISQIGDNTV